jgi:hypothetical protein
MIGFFMSLHAKFSEWNSVMDIESPCDWHQSTILTNRIALPYGSLCSWPRRPVIGLIAPSPSSIVQACKLATSRKLNTLTFLRATATAGGRTRLCLKRRIANDAREHNRRPEPYWPSASETKSGVSRASDMSRLPEAKASPRTESATGRLGRRAIGLPTRLAVRVESGRHEVGNVAYMRPPLADIGAVDSRPTLQMVKCCPALRTGSDRPFRGVSLEQIEAGLGTELSSLRWVNIKRHTALLTMFGEFFGHQVGIVPQVSN